ncbi:type II toxin-antitoxin system HipA family toxin [Ottowia testudinis]|uniref:Type II toxin-antitoxin system HipA family toxin n=1 Tax=Ottowia testudinis TaxID=2816950 RepID=A0A975CHK7_9BURK|nr:type II toxin-antitoxin system HipA family toxin [Ottowia testudinis]QTD46568.1 type II toxin-antitoxin system HipA family toxin [Ottowia testudinis]
MPRTTALDLFYGAAHVGTVHDGSPLVFEYAPGWLARGDAFALCTIALRPGLVDSAEVTAFFENLLPEGDLRVYMVQQRKASTLFSLLLEVAGDTAGAFVLLPRGQQPAPPRYEPTTWQALADTIHRKSAAAIQWQRGRTRISLAGAQDKASIAIFDGHTPMLPQGAAPSTHIIKPDIRRLPKVRESAANEAITMRTALYCGLNTARVFYEPLTRACIVERFDRVAQPDGRLGRLVQYDFCQLSGLDSGRKYEKEGGPSLADCAALVRQYSARPALDLAALAQWVLFNLYTGNNDSHAKNLSIYHRDGEGARLTPFYDLMCTRIYPGLSNEFAFSLAGEARPGQFGPAQVQALAQQLGMGQRYVQSMALELADRLPAAMEQAASDIAPHLTASGQSFAEKLALKLTSVTRRMVLRMVG